MRGFLVDFVRRHGSTCIVRGARAVSDFEYEFQMAGMNQKLMPEVETIFLTPAEQFQFISGTFVREIAMMGGDVSGFVPQNILAALKENASNLSKPLFNERFAPQSCSARVLPATLRSVFLLRGLQ